MLADYLRLMRPLAEGEDGEPAVAQAAGRFKEANSTELEIVDAHRRSQSGLIQDLVGSVHSQAPPFFEDLVIDLLLAMGYGARRRDLTKRLGRSGDGGVDGVIQQDELGLDPIYLQAKRLRPGDAVPVSDVRDFVGSLDAHHANKGIFVTTSYFTHPAIDVCKKVSRQVSLIDGQRLAQLMIRYNIGVSVIETYQIKRVDRTYFSSLPGVRAREMISASIQPRRYEAAR